MNAVKGLEFRATFPVFTPGRKGKFIKTVEVAGTVTNDTCYDVNRKHWIFFQCTETSDPNYFEVGKIYKKQGKNFYPAVKSYTYPADYNQAAELKDLLKQSALA